MRHGFLIGLVVIAGPLWAGNDLDSLQRVAAEDIRKIAEAVHRFAIAENYYPGRSPGSEFVPVETLRQDLVPEYLTVVPAADPWGRTYWYWTNGEHFIVGSGGPEAAEGTWHEVIEQSPRGPSHALESVCSSPGKGSVLLIDGRFCALSKDITHGPPTGTLTDQERGALSIEDLRAIAVAVMAYGVDNNAYPVLADGITGAGALRSLLEPNYIRVFPLSDAWERPYFYWSNGKTFVVYSTGGDAEDRLYGSSLQNDVGVVPSSFCKGPSRRPGADIIFANGAPCQWPEGTLD
jgi:hypothetical protein